MDSFPICFDADDARREDQKLSGEFDLLIGERLPRGESSSAGGRSKRKVCSGFMCSVKFADASESGRSSSSSGSSLKEQVP